jgi:hypothetical protein
VRTTWTKIMATCLKRPTGAELPTEPILPPDATPGQRRRFYRDLVIYIASRHGISQRKLALAFDLEHSRIGAIIKDFGALCGQSNP